MNGLRKSLQELAGELQPPPGTGDDVFTAQSVSGHDGVELARNDLGLAVLVEGGEARAPLELMNLRASFRRRCLILEEDRTNERDMMVVQFVGHDPELESLFLDSVSLLLLRPDPPTASSIFEFVTNLQSLFANPAATDDRIILGLWGELFVLVHGSDPGLSTSAWHGNPSERFDFALGSERVEVKTTSVGPRSHEFSLEQLRPPAPLEVVVASIVTTRGPGRTVGQLIEDACLLATTKEGRDQVLNVADNTLKNGGIAGYGTAFDEIHALESLRFFDAGLIPSVELPPVEVSAVRFKVNLTGVESISSGSPSRPLLTALIPST